MKNIFIRINEIFLQKLVLLEFYYSFIRIVTYLTIKRINFNNDDFLSFVNELTKFISSFLQNNMRIVIQFTKEFKGFRNVLHLMKNCDHF